jgi:adenosine deaminase
MVKLPKQQTSFRVLTLFLLILILIFIIILYIRVSVETFLKTPVKTISPTKLKEFIRKAPKTDLHFHIESGTNPDLAFKIAKRNKIYGTKAWPWKTTQDLEKALQFKDLESFLEIYYAVSNALTHPQDFYDQAENVVQTLIASNVRHAELFFDPQTFTSRNISFKNVADGFNRGLDVGRRQGLSISLIVSILRDSPIGTPEDFAPVDQGFSSKEKATAWASIKQAVEYNKTAPLHWKLVGVGLDSNEKPYPPHLFKDIYEFAGKHGFLRTAHAGEEGPASYIWECIRDLHCVRIDHGVHCVEDSNLCAYLATPLLNANILNAYHTPHQIPITCCPLSNSRLKVFKNPSDINLGIMLNLGLQVTVNSDDPMYTGWVNDSYDLLIDHCMENSNNTPITFANLRQLIINGFEGSWLPLDKKISFIREVNQYFIGSSHLLYNDLVNNNNKIFLPGFAAIPRLA